MMPFMTFGGSYGWPSLAVPDSNRVHMRWLRDSVEAGTLLSTRDPISRLAYRPLPFSLPIPEFRDAGIR